MHIRRQFTLPHAIRSAITTPIIFVIMSSWKGRVPCHIHQLCMRSQKEAWQKAEMCINCACLDIKGGVTKTKNCASVLAETTVLEKTKARSELAQR